MFLHGVETIEFTSGSVPVTVVKSAVIGLIGTAPKGPVNELIVVNNATEAAQFGDQVDGFTIPQALDAIFKQGAATVMVVNVADLDVNVIAVVDEALTITSGAASLAYAPVAGLVIEKSAFEYVKDTHYTVDAFGNIVFIGDAVNGVSAVTGVAATCEFEVTAGSVGSGNQITQVYVDGVALLTSPIAFVTDDAGTATAVAAAIDANADTTGWGASASSGVVTITRETTGSEWNGSALSVVVGGDVEVDNLEDVSGGVDAVTAVPAATTSVTASYSRFNEASITTARLVGTIDSETGEKTGTKLYKDAFNLVGFKAKIFIIPVYSTENAIATELIALAEEHKGICIIDAPIGTTPAVAIAGRGSSGTINFNTSSARALLAYPHMKVYNNNTETTENRPYSQFLAGVIANTDNTRGYWISPSNKEIKGVLGAERNISAAINDPSSETNQLNAVGITTVFNSFGTGLRVWGNRTAKYPSSTFPDNFLNIRRTADVVHESIELAMLQFIDEPLDPANRVTIDAILDTVNAFIRDLIGRGALIEGSECKYIDADNPAENLAAGQVTFSLEFMVPPPAERITFKSFIDLSLLAPQA